MLGQGRAPHQQLAWVCALVAIAAHLAVPAVCPELDDAPASTASSQTQPAARGNGAVWAQQAHAALTAADGAVRDAAQFDTQSLEGLRHSGLTARAWFARPPPTAPELGALARSTLGAWAVLIQLTQAVLPRDPTWADDSPLTDAHAARTALLGLSALRATTGCPELLGPGGPTDAGVASLGLQLTALAVDGWVAARAALAGRTPHVHLNTTSTGGGAPLPPVLHPLHPLLRRSLGRSIARLRRLDPSAVSQRARAALDSLAAHALFSDEEVAPAMAPAAVGASAAAGGAGCASRLVLHANGAPPPRGQLLQAPQPLGSWEDDWFEELLPERVEWVRVNAAAAAADPLGFTHAVGRGPPGTERCWGGKRHAPVVALGDDGSRRLLPAAAVLAALHAGRMQHGVLHASDESLASALGYYRTVGPRGFVARQYWSPAAAARGFGQTHATLQWGAGGPHEAAGGASADAGGVAVRLLQAPLGYKAGFWLPTEEEAPSSRAADGTPVRLPPLRREAVMRRPLAERNFTWAFVGSLGKSGRRDAIQTLLDAQLPGRPFTLEADGFAPRETMPQRLSAPQLRNRVADAAFQACPMRNVNTDTFRTSETLEAGSIPVVPGSAPGALPRGLPRPGDYWRGVFGEDHPLLVADFLPAGQGGAADALAALLAPPQAHALELYHQALVDWWLAHKWNLRAQLALWLAELQGAAEPPPQQRGAMCASRRRVPAGDTPLSLLAS